jgi:hypothetical protein
MSKQQSDPVAEEERNRLKGRYRVYELSIKKRVLASKLRQQELFAWRPTYTAGVVIPLAFLIGIILIVIGVFTLVAINSG